MNKSRPFFSPHTLHWGALEIAGIYLIVGALWILFSDQVAARVAVNEQMLQTIKGWAYVLITAILLYGLIQRHTARLHSSRMQLQRVLDALPALISYVDQDQRYRFTNRAYQGWFEGETLGKHIREVIGTPAYQSALKYIDKVLSGETVRYETEIVLPAGERFISAICVPDIGVNGKVEGFFTLGHDVTEQKQALEERRLWADAFEGCAHGIAIGDPNTNRIVVCNPAFAKLQKSRVEDIVGAAILSLYAASDHEHVRRNVQKADQIGHTCFEARMLRKDSSTFPVEMDVVSILGEDGEVLHRVVTAQDISERRQAERVLKESEERYRIVSELTSDYAYMDRVEADGSIVPEWITESFTRITGYTLEEAQAPGFWQQLVYPDDMPLLVEHIEKTLSGRPHTLESRVITKLGEIRWLRDYSNPVWDAGQGRVVGLHGAVQDITEYKHAEEKLRLQARWLEQINDAVITSDTNLVITAWNPAAERVYGWKAEEVIGKSGEEVLRSEFFSNTRAEVLRELKERGEFSAEITQLRKDETRIHIETRTVTLRDESGHAIGYLSVNRDITERKQAEQENASLARFPAENPNPVMRATHEGKIIYANAASEPLLQDWHAKVGDRLPADWIQMIQEIIETGVGKTIDVPCGPTTYSIMIVYAPDANDVNIYGRDITERKRMEEAALESETRYHRLLDSMMEGGQIIGFDWRYLYVNSVAAAQGRQNPEDLLGRTMMEVYPGIEQTELFEVLRRCMQERTSRRMENQFIFPDGRVGWFELSIQPAEEGIFILSTDITERKLGEENLHRFELLSEHSRDIILFMGSKDGRILEANAAAVHTYGYSRDELLTLAVRDLRDIDTVGLTAEQMAQADDRGILFETLHRRKDGTTFPVEVSSQGATIGGRRTLISIIRDITERKNAEKALTESEARFRSLFEQSADANLLIENNIFTDCNQAAIRMMRADGREDILSTHPSKLSPEYQPDGQLSSEKADEMIRIALEKGSNRFEWIHRRKDGIDFPVEVLLTSISTGDRQVIHVVWRDITERKQIEQALQAAHDELEIKVQERTAELSEANALLQALMDNLPDHIYFKDTQSRFIRNSRSQASLLGLNDPSEVVGKTDFDFFPHAARSFAEEQEVMRSGKPIVDLEEWVVWPDGHETWVLTTKLPLRSSEGETIGIFGISHDITERKRAEQAIRQLNADLEKQAEQLQAANKELEAFSYSVSHDLRAPLRAIDGYTRILVEDYESILDDEGKRVCSVISREARRMGQLIDDLLSFSRLGRKEMYSSKIEMRTLAVSVLNELLKEEKRERFDIHIANLPVVKGDSSLIRQVWVNLLSNAIKFTSKKERAVIEVGGKTTKDEFIYYVRDNGAGFEMEYANKLFGVFQRLHSESEFSGTGVGLAIVQRIVRRHNGRVWAEGEVDKGAIFYFAIPRKENLS